MCTSPVVCYRSKSFNPASGKYGITHDIRKALDGRPIERPCGVCIECRIQDASDKTVRMVHESKSHDVNTFVTLTYDKKHLPADGSLNHRHFQLFMKRLRERTAFKFKYYMCGEYGESLDRPHYHAILFGCDFNDRVFYKRNKNGDNLDTSRLLEAQWGLGMCTVGDVSQTSCRYVAGYVTKKISGDPKEAYYGGRRPEYGFGSNGLGLEYLRKFGHQWMSQGYIMLDGSKYRIPRYYDIKYREIDGQHLDIVKDERARRAALADRDPNKVAGSNKNRYDAIDESIKARLKKKGRDYET